jgi:hypothetical protein
MARPSKYTKQLVDKICERISTSSDGLRTICKDKDMPSIFSIVKWLNEKEEFSIQYARAKELQADFMVDEIIEIADTCKEGKKTIEKPGGIEITTGDMVERSRLMIESRKWLSSKLKPKKYGDKLDVTTGNKPIQQSILNITIDGKDINLT